MTREEAIQILSTRDRYGVPCGYTSGYQEALDMAIEALQEPKTIIGIDIPYGGSDKGLATIFKGNEKMVLEEVKEIMSVVRCKDCKHRPIKEDADGEDYGFNLIEPNDGNERCTCLVSDGWYSWMPKDDFYCGYGEREGE